jgi:cell division protease FtsH
VVVSLVLVWQIFYNIRDVKIEETDFASFYKDMMAKKIKVAKIAGEDLEGEYLNGRRFKTVIPAQSTWELVKSLIENGVSVKVEKPVNTSLIYVFLSSWMPFILMIGFWIFLLVVLKKKS